MSDGIWCFCNVLCVFVCMFIIITVVSSVYIMFEHKDT